MYSRRSWWSRRRACCVALALLAVTLQLVRLPASARLETRVAAPPARLAHLLGDFSHRHSSSDKWALEDEAGNYTSWRYSVAYSCGSRCSGRAEVEAHEEPRAGAPEHGSSARRHTVRVRDSRCVTLPLLPWPQLCEESESEVRVSAAGAGSLVAERATAWCMSLRTWLGACESELRAHLEGRVRRLRAAGTATLPR